MHRQSCKITLEDTILKISPQLHGHLAAVPTRLAKPHTLIFVFLWGNLPQEETVLLPTYRLAPLKKHIFLSRMTWKVLGNRTQVAYCVRAHTPWQTYKEAYGSTLAFACIVREFCAISPFCLRKVFLLADIFQSLCPLSSPLTYLPVLPPHPCLSFSISFLGHLVNLFSDMPNSCNVSPCLVSPLVLSSDRTSTVSYVHHIILLPKNLTCTDWTTQSRVQVASTPPQVHTSAVLVCTYFSWSPLSRAWLSWEGVWPVDLPGAVGKQADGLQWWLNHLLGASEG